MDKYIYYQQRQLGLLRILIGSVFIVKIINDILGRPISQENWIYIFVGIQVFLASAFVLGIYTSWATLGLLLCETIVILLSPSVYPLFKSDLRILFTLIFVYFHTAGAGRFSLDSYLGKTDVKVNKDTIL